MQNPSKSDLIVEWNQQDKSVVYLISFWTSDITLNLSCKEILFKTSGYVFKLKISSRYLKITFLKKELWKRVILEAWSTEAAIRGVL